MHKISFPVTFVSSSAPVKQTPDGEKRYYVANLLADDGNIDRFFLDKQVFDSVSPCILGDKLTVNARLFYAPNSSSWALKIDSITPSV